jgi:hypothetical protein
MNFESWQGQDDLFECLVILSRKLQEMPTPPVQQMALQHQMKALVKVQVGGLDDAP